MHMMAANPENEPQTPRANGRVNAVAWTAGLTAFFAVAAISDSPTWPVACVAGCAVAMVAFVCHLILRKQGG